MFIQNTSIYNIKVKQTIFYIRFADYSSSLRILYVYLFQGNQILTETGEDWVLTRIGVITH